MNFRDDLKPYSCTRFSAGLNCRVHGALNFDALPVMLDGQTIGAAFRTSKHSVTAIFDKRERAAMSVLEITKRDLVIRDGALQILLPASYARRLRRVA